MSTPRFHCPVPLASGQTLALPETVFAHAVRVLRLETGAAVTLFNGEGGEYAATLTEVGKNRATAQVGEYSREDRESPLDVWLLQALASGDKMDWVVQKAVELGATAVLPWRADRSVLKLSGDRADKRQAHWQGIVTAACEQCGRNRLPSVAAPQSLEAVLTAAGGRHLLHLDPGGSPARDLKAGPLALVIGPEGGFTDAESALLMRAGACSLALGPRILRTETAGLAALAALQAVLGDLQVKALRG